MLKSLQSFLLALARSLPRGGFPLVRSLANRDVRLQNYPVPLSIRPSATLRLDLRESVSFPLFRYGDYPHQKAEDCIDLKLLNPGDVVWDVGANIGYKTLLYADAVGGAGRVIAFEPSPRIFTLLKRVAADRDNVVVLNQAVSDTDGSCFFDDAAFSDLSRICPKGQNTIAVQAVRLDSTLPHHPPPSFLKIDVEGQEAAVILGASNLIRTSKPTIQFEALSAAALQKLIAVLQEISCGEYTFYGIGSNGTLKAATGDTPSTTHNFYAVRTSQLERLGALIEGGLA